MRFPRCQFSLTLMILMVALIAAMLGVYVSMRAESLNQRRQVELLVDRGGGFYEHTQPQNRFGVLLGFEYPADQIRAIKGKERADWGMTPGWQCNDNDLQILRSFHNLEDLYVSDSMLSNRGLEELSHIPKLRLLEFHDCDLMQCDLSVLADNAALQRLNLYYSKINDSDLTELRNRNPNLEIREIAD